MPSLTIRNLEPETKDELRRRASLHGRSMQDEARQILRSILLVPTSGSKGGSLYERIRSRFQPLGGVDLELSPRGQLREPPRFD